MRTYGEFRLVVAPVLGDATRWTVRLDRSPIALQTGQLGDVKPTLTREQIGLLQAGGGWPNINTLKAIGDSVWSSLLPAPLNASFVAAYQYAQVTNKGMRVVLVRQVSETEALAPGQVGLPEVPFEAIRQPGANFLALDELTPVSRGLQVEADQPAYHVDPPLRILVVVAKPDDKPHAAVGDEAAAISGTVAPLGGLVSLKVSPSGTYDEFRAQLDAFRPHVVHFVGHGGYAVIGDDPTSQPHLCFVRGDNGQSRYVDADTLSDALQNREVRLVVLTACQSAAAAPALDGAYDPRAMDGIAQRLVLGSSGVSAAVAMQFDFEAAAAVAFSRELYRHLLDPERALDEAVTLARKEILQQLAPGHRAWVTPVVYWRCRDGRVFDIGAIDGPPDPAGRAELQALEVARETRIKTMAEFQDLFAGQPAGAGILIGKSMKVLAEIDDRRSVLFRQCVRLSAMADTTIAGSEARLRILLRTAVAGQVDLVRLRAAPGRRGDPEAGDRRAGAAARPRPGPHAGRRGGRDREQPLGRSALGPGRARDRNARPRRRCQRRVRPGPAGPLRG